MKKLIICFLAVAAVFAFTALVLADEGSAGAPAKGRICKTKAPACGTGPQCNTFTFDGTASSDPNRDKLTYLWDLGDGTTSTEPVVTHTYAKGGRYTVNLTVRDDSGLPCDTASTTEVVAVNLPPTAEFSANDNVCVGDTVSFDASASADDNPAKLAYMWDFGDGEKGEGVRTTHVYKNAGVHTARLTVNDGEGTPCSVAGASKAITVNGNPIADAGCDIEMCFAPDQDMGVTLNGGNSRDPGGDKLAYAWDFGDGSKGEGQIVSHVYKQPGVYNAKLTVDDGRGTKCSSASDTATLNLNKRPVANAGEDINVCLGNVVEFDGSASIVPAGSKATYAWDFGDGSKGEGVRVTHAYEKGGKYKAVLMVNDGRGSKCSTSVSSVNVSINSSPKACFVNPAIACVGQKVAFDACCSEPESCCLKYTWDFGDGETLEAGCCKVTHVYKKGGTYTVRLTVDDKKGTPCSLDSTSSNIRINTAPVAKAGADLACCEGMESTFDASGSIDADGDSLTYMWNFGDGTTAEGVRVKHAFAKGGTYKVTLKVDDNSGTACNSSVSSLQVVVKGAPVPKIQCK